jgi:hypothetical protein
MPPRDTPADQLEMGQRAFRRAVPSTLPVISCIHMRSVSHGTPESGRRPPTCAPTSCGRAGQFSRTRSPLLPYFRLQMQTRVRYSRTITLTWANDMRTRHDRPYAADNSMPKSSVGSTPPRVLPQIYGEVLVWTCYSLSRGTGCSSLIACGKSGMLVRRLSAAGAFCQTASQPRSWLELESTRSASICSTD